MLIPLPDAIEVTIPVRLIPDPLNDVAVTTPEAFRLVAPIVPTVILGVPERPVAFPVTFPVTLPVKAPTKLDAVTTPEAFSCLTNNVGPVTVVIPAKVETPVTFRLVNVEVPDVSIPATLLLPPEALIVSPPAVTLLNVIFVPAVKRISSVVESDPVNLRLTLLPSATAACVYVVFVSVPVTVTIPAETADTDRLDPKLIVPAVPTSVPSSLTMTPEPEPITPESPEPSPTKENAVTMPLTVIPCILKLVVVERPTSVTWVKRSSAIMVF